MNPDKITTQYVKVGKKWRIQLIIDKITYMGKVIDKLPFKEPIHPSLRKDNYIKCDQLPARNVPRRLQTSLRGNYRGKSWIQ